MPPVGSHKSAKTDILGALGNTGQVSEWSASMNSVGASLMAIYTGAGMSKAGAAGMIGNQVQESSLDPTAPGGGLSQWIGARASALASYASSIGKRASSVEAQGNFTVQELRTGYPQLWTYLQTVSDPAAAALAISQQYERPASWAANNANRQKQAQLAFDGVSAAPASNGGNSGTSGGSGGFSPLDALMAFATGNFQVLAGQLASLAFTMIKDTAIGFGDLVIVPFWHWNQRATQNYWYMMTDPQQSVWMLPGTAVFWGFGYWLLWTDPDQKGLMPQPVQRARLARHVRDIQAIPARRSLVRPRDVTKRTIKKPKATVSRALITQTGTMRATRIERVTVSGQHRSLRDGTDSTVNVERAGTVRADQADAGQARQAEGKTAATEPDSQHRAGNVSLPRSRNGARSPATAGRGPRGRA